MVNKKITELTALTDPLASDLLVMVDDPSGSPITKKITFSDIFGGIPSDSVIDVGVTWPGDFSGDTMPRVTALFPWATPAKLSNPAALPAGDGRESAWSPNGEFLSVAHETTPYITIYQRSGTTFTKLANPAALPAGIGIGVAWSPNGEFLTVAHETTPYITIYQTASNMPAEGIMRIIGVRREGV